MTALRSFRETISDRARRDSRFRKALLAEAMGAFLAGEEALGRAILRDLINATIGFEDLARRTGKPAKSLHRMLGAAGNPNTSNFFLIVRALEEALKVRLTVRAA